MVIRRAGYFFGPSARRTGANLRIWVAQAAQPDRPIPVRMTQFVRISESPERLEGRARGGLRCSPAPARSVRPTRRPGAARSSTVTARPAPSMRAAATSIQALRSSTAPTSVPWPPTRTHQPRLIHRCRHPTHRTHPRIRQPTGPELGPQQRQPHQRVRHPNIHTSRRTTQPHMTHQPMPSTGIPPHHARRRSYSATNPNHRHVIAVIVAATPEISAPKHARHPDERLIPTKIIDSTHTNKRTRRG